MPTRDGIPARQDRQPLVVYNSAPAPIVTIAVTEHHLLVGTSKSELLLYLSPPRWSDSPDGRAGGRIQHLGSPYPV